jgi:hypothetical protein
MAVWQGASPFAAFMENVKESLSLLQGSPTMLLASGRCWH